MDVSSSNKAIAKKLATAFGGKASVASYRDEAEKSSVAILTCRDAPQEHVNSYATVTLANHPILQDGREFPARVELVAACEAAATGFENVLSTCAFNVINDGWFVGPGVVFPDVLSMYGLSDTLAHVIFVSPMLWDGQVTTTTVEGRTLAFLQAIPISEAEYRFAETRGPDALEDLFERRQIDVFDIDRVSVV